MLSLPRLAQWDITYKDTLPQFRAGGYSLNEWVIDKGPDLWVSGFSGESLNLFFGFESRVVNPAQTPVLCDGAYFWTYPRASNAPPIIVDGQVGGLMGDNGRNYSAIPRHGNRGQGFRGSRHGLLIGRAPVSALSHRPQPRHAPLLSRAGPFYDKNYAARIAQAISPRSASDPPGLLLACRMYRQLRSGSVTLSLPSRGVSGPLVVALSVQSRLPPGSGINCRL